MKRRQHDALPDDLTTALLWFAEVMYYRFEFSRGAYWFDEVGRADPYRELFPRVMGRDRFMAPDGPTYLEHLKQDIRRAGKRREEAKALLRDFVEYSLSPLTDFEQSSAFLCVRHVEPFFPDREDVEHRLRDYCFQLMELQEYLTAEIGVKPGSLLPVWITGEASQQGEVPAYWCEALTQPSAVPDLMWGNVVKIDKLPPVIDRAPGILPLLGSIPVDSYIVGTLAAYISWEYGYSRFTIGKPPARREHTGFYPQALRWGRLMYYRWLQGVCAEGNVDYEVEEWANIDRRRRKTLVRILADEEPWLKDLPISMSDEILRELLSDGQLVDKYIRPIGGKSITWKTKKTVSGDVKKTTFDKVDVKLLGDAEARKEYCIQLSKDPGFRKNVVRGMNVGFYLFYGYCRHFWRL